MFLVCVLVCACVCVCVGDWVCCVCVWESACDAQFRSQDNVKYRCY